MKLNWRQKKFWLFLTSKAYNESLLVPVICEIFLYKKIQTLFGVFAIKNGSMKKKFIGLSVKVYEFSVLKLYKIAVIFVLKMSNSYLKGTENVELCAPSQSTKTLYFDYLF